MDDTEDTGLRPEGTTDREWRRNLLAALGPARSGKRKELAERMGRHQSDVRKLVTGELQDAVPVFEASRWAMIPPPRAVLSDEQYRALAAIEELREAGATGREMRAFVRRVEEFAAELGRVVAERDALLGSDEDGDHETGQ